MYKRDDNLCVVKSVEKLMDWAKSSRAEIFKLLHSDDMLIFKNAKWATFVYMIKHITQTVTIYFWSRYDGQKPKSWYDIVSTCYFSLRVRDTCTKIWDLSGYITPRTHYIHFLDGSLLYMSWGLVWKVKGQVRVYSHDLKLQGSWNTILFLHNFVLLLKK